MAKIPVPKYGSTFYNQKTGKAEGINKFDPNTGKALTDPTITSTSYRSGVDALGKDINKAYDSSGLSKTRTDMEKILKSEKERLKADYEEDAFGINSAYREASRIQGERQTKDYAGRSTSLVTSGGGFLGATQSQSGVLQNLSNDFENEKGALMAKRDAALQASRSAYNDKAFKMATQELEIAKNAEQELYNRQKDFADQQLALARESRASDEYSRDKAKDSLDLLTNMEDEDFANVDEASIKAIDEIYGAGFTQSARKIQQKANNIKTQSDQTKLELDILQELRQIPSGQKVVLGGKTYYGKKQPSGTSMKGVITPIRAQTAGLPNSVVGMDEKDMILSLEMNKPAQWFIDYLETSGQNRPPYIPLTQSQILSQWNALRQDDDMVAYRNTVKLDQRNGINSGDDDELMKAIEALSGEEE